VDVRVHADAAGYVNKWLVYEQLIFLNRRLTCTHVTGYHTSLSSRRQEYTPCAGGKQHRPRRDPLA
jgi:hypothetical protein